jgi:hypothetical protein
MKHLLTIFCLTLTLISKNQAATLTVNNTNPTIGQYSTVQAAVDAAASGDVILIQGSQTTYPDFTLPADKALTLRGPGWRPLYRQSPMPARISTITLAGKAHDITIEGLYISGINMGQVYENDRWLKHQYNIKIQFCRLDGISLAQGCRDFTIENNYCGTVHGGNDTTTNILIRNNYFQGGSTVRHFNNCGNILVDHNLFVGGELYDLNTILLSNNIFHYCNVSYSNLNRCIIANNLTYHPNNTTSPYFYNDPNNPYRSVIGESNLQNIDPLFVYGNDQRDINADYHLQPTSPAKNAGTDGKDIGIINVSALSKTGEVAPAVRSFNIANPVTTPTGNLIIKMTASKARLDKD